MSTQISELAEASKFATGTQADWRSVAAVIDHTLLAPATTQQQIHELCAQAVHYGFACVFVNPTYAALAVSILDGSNIKVGTPVGFPLGASLTTTKRHEALEAVRVGVSELDMVINLGALKSGERQLVQNDIKAVANVAHDAGAILKVIIEAGLLTLEEKIIACELSVAAGGDFVKTNTGFLDSGATADDVALMRGVVGDRAGVKASGGLHTLHDVLTMIHAGANRIGTSSGIAIVQELGAPPL
jgi:deoxyribose-phosphate aldolase